MYTHVIYASSRSKTDTYHISYVMYLSIKCIVLDCIDPTCIILQAVQSTWKPRVSAVHMYDKISTRPGVL